MAKIVIAGAVDCPYFARVELLADRLALNLPDFKLHKIVKLPEEWQEWLTEECQKRGWQHSKSPIVWRELVNRGGKGMLIGGANEFQEYVHNYYNITSQMTGDDMIRVAQENVVQKNSVDEEEHRRKDEIKPVRICVTNASSALAYGIVAALATGDVFGPGTDMALHLYDESSSASVLHGVAMELTDLALPRLRETRVATDIDEAMEDCKVLVILDEVERDSNETEELWLKRNHEHFSVYSAALERLDEPDIKVIISGRGPVNFIANMITRFAPSVSSRNVVAVPWLVENLAKATLAEKLKVNSALITDVVVWGSINGCHVIDVSWGRIYEYDGAIWGPRPFSVPLKEMVHDDDDSWLETKLAVLVDQRRSVEEWRTGRPSAMSAGDGLSMLLKDWWMGSATGEMHSIATASQGWYDVPEGLVFSFPARFRKAGEYEIISDLEITTELRTKIQDLIEGLEIEVEAIFPNPDRKLRKKIEFILTMPSDEPPSIEQDFQFNGYTGHENEERGAHVNNQTGEKIESLDRIPIPEDVVEDDSVELTEAAKDADRNPDFGLEEDEEEEEDDEN